MVNLAVMFCKVINQFLENKNVHKNVLESLR